MFAFAVAWMVESVCGCWWMFVRLLRWILGSVCPAQHDQPTVLCFPLAFGQLKASSLMNSPLGVTAFGQGTHPPVLAHLLEEQIFDQESGIFHAQFCQGHGSIFSCKGLIGCPPKADHLVQLGRCG